MLLVANIIHYSGLQTFLIKKYILYHNPIHTYIICIHVQKQNKALPKTLSAILLRTLLKRETEETIILKTNAIRNLLDLINDFGKISVYKINAWKSFVFLY